MKSNDTLLCHMMATDEMKKGAAPQYKTDDIIYNPTHIKVAANEVVYIHFFHSHVPEFNIKITTPTGLLTLSPDNAINGSSNTIIRAIGDISFTSMLRPSFFVQLIKIHY